MKNVFILKHNGKIQTTGEYSPRNVVFFTYTALPLDF